jgi:hypothetical protein
MIFSLVQSEEEEEVERSELRLQKSDAARGMSVQNQGASEDAAILEALRRLALRRDKGYGSNRCSEEAEQRRRTAKVLHRSDCVLFG